MLNPKSPGITDFTYQWGPMNKLASVTTYRERDADVGGGQEPQPTIFRYDNLGEVDRGRVPGSHQGDQQLSAWTTRCLEDPPGRDETNQLRRPGPGRLSHLGCGRRAWDHSRLGSANRLTSISNICSVIEYEYDDAGQVKWERNTVTGSSGPPRRIISAIRNGEVANTNIPTGRWSGVITQRGDS